MTTRTDRACELAGIASALAWLMGEAHEFPAGAAARGWKQDALDGMRSLTWLEPGGSAVRVDLWAGTQKVFSSRLQSGAAALEIIAFRRGPWEQELVALGEFIGAGLAEVASPVAWGLTVH